MNTDRDTIIKLAQEAGLEHRAAAEEFNSPYCDGVYLDDLERFAAIVEQHLIQQGYRQRKPLTDEDIDRIDACIDKFTPLREGKRLFARAVERAHGIKE